MKTQRRITAIMLGNNGMVYDGQLLQLEASSKTGARQALRDAGYKVCVDGGLAEVGHDETWHVTVWGEK